MKTLVHKSNMNHPGKSLYYCWLSLHYIMKTKWHKSRLEFDESEKALNNYINYSILLRNEIESAIEHLEEEIKKQKK